jgi:hypothetical protein
VVVEKRKWDGSVAARSHALLLSGGPQVVCWITPAGTLRERPRKGQTEVVERPEIWMSGGRWWVVSASPEDDGRVCRYTVDAGLAPRPPQHGVLSFVDLDLDLDIRGDRVGLKDIADFCRRTVSMRYPPRVVAGAVLGVLDAAWRVQGRRWPFDGWLATRLREGMAYLEDPR